MFLDTKKLGQLLVRNNLLTEFQLQEVMNTVRNNGNTFSDILISKGIVSEKEILRIESDQIGYKFVDLIEQKPDPKAVKILPRHISEKYKVVVIGKEDKKISIAMVNPLNVFAIDDVRMLTNLEVIPYLSSETDIQTSIEEGYSQLESANEIIDEIDTPLDNIEIETQEVSEDAILTTTKLIAMSDEAPVVKLSGSIIMQAVKDGASDIHIEPLKNSLRVRFRLDGVLHQIMELPKKIHPPLVSRFKILAKLDIAERRLPQDGRIPLRVEGREIDLRVASLPTVWGEKVTMRILDKTSVLIGMERLGFESEDLAVFMDLIHKPYGIIFSTGPTGSGKTTTLYAVLNELNSSDINIISIEDPIEYQLPGIAQAQVNEKAGLTFASGLRSILRQDPDIVMVGELRDRETAETAVQASLTGHLVLATIHANDTASTITRMFHMGVEPFLVASSVVCILAQRLVRTICPECKESYNPPSEAMERIGIPPGTPLFRGRGCEFCRGTGYMGRLGVYELLKLDDEVRDLIVQKASAPAIKRKALELGMYTLQQDGIRKVINGRVSIEEAIRVLFDTT